MPGERRPRGRRRGPLRCRAEDDEVVRRARPRRARRVEHDELAGGGEDGVDRHQHEDGENAVVREEAKSPRRLYSARV